MSPRAGINTVDRLYLARRLSQESPGSPFAAQLRKASEPQRLNLDQLETELDQHHGLGHLLRPNERQVYEPVRSILSARDLFSTEVPSISASPVKKDAPSSFVAPTRAWSTPAEDAVCRPVLGRNGAELFQLSRTGELLCFDPENGQPTRSLRLSSGLSGFYDPQLTADGKHLIISGQANGSRLWKVNLETLEVEWKRELPAGKIWGKPAIGPDGIVAVHVRNQQQLEVLDPQTGDTVTTLKLEAETDPDQWANPPAPRFSADGERLHFSYFGADRQGRHLTFDARTGGELWRQVEPYARYIWSIPCGETLLAFSGDGKLEALDARSGAQCWGTNTQLFGSDYPPVLSPDGKLLAVPVNKGMALIDTACGAVRHQVPTVIRAGDFTAPVFTEDGAALIAHEDRGHFHRIDLATGGDTLVDAPASGKHPYSDGYAVAPGAQWAFHTYDRQLKAVELKPREQEIR